MTRQGPSAFPIACYSGTLNQTIESLHASAPIFLSAFLVISLRLSGKDGILCLRSEMSV